MKKILKISMVLVLAGLFLPQCKKKEEETIVSAKISGTVTYADFSSATNPAAGAVISLYNGSTASGTPAQTTIADADGKYKFEKLSEGSYYLLAEYNTENTNLKSDGIDGINFVSAGDAVTITSADVTKDITVSNYTSSGSDHINTYDATWSKESHSRVVFSFPYKGEQVVFTGGFKTFTVKMDFNEADLSTAKIEATVDLSTVDTFEPGRDGAGKCVQTSLGVVYNTTLDTIVSGQYATLTSTSISKYGDGYLAKCDMNFKGVTHNVDLFFKYLGQVDVTSSSGAVNPYADFEGEFTFKAITDYAVSSTSIADDVTVNCHIMFKGPATTK